MELLVACPGCARRRDLSGLGPGTTVPCSCGAAWTVPAPFRGDADVVRCSACGSPRQGGESQCRFCRAEFTIHERDLDVVCAQCFHRASSRSRFCHHCGLPLLRDQARQPSELSCPACGDGTTLSSRSLGIASLAVLECRRCAGLWLDGEAFRLLEERARSGSGGGADPVLSSWQPVSPQADGARLYRPCPHCSQLMHRRNYGRSSGVLIDTCAAHGVWFDHEELARILRWIGTGGPEREHRRRLEEAASLERQRRMPAAAPLDMGGSLPATGGTLTTLDLVGDLIRWLSERLGR